MKQTKWFHNATLMAFFAVIALLASPVLAFACCCDAAPAEIVLAQHLRTNMAPVVASPGHECCAPEAASTQLQARVAVSSALADCATITRVCDCQKQLVTRDLVVPDANLFAFSPALAPSTSRDFAVNVADVRRMAWACYAARPRSPDRTCAPGRAPPALARS